MRFIFQEILFYDNLTSGMFYPYPVASRINQQIIAKHKEGSLTETIKKLLHTVYKIFS